MTPSASVGRKRLSGDERRRAVLAAAREVFTKTGDIGGTTTKKIAQHAGISEAIIYRYFASKEELYFDAVVEPLTEIVERTVAGIERYPKGITEEEKIERIQRFYNATLASLEECLPLLGLVLFGDPKTAKRFYERCWNPALDRLSEVWTRHYRDAGLTEYPRTDVAARVTLGTCMMYALDAVHGEATDRREIARQLTDAVIYGAFTIRGW